jgi:hypothetical protein
MSSIMRRRSGLMGAWLMGAPGLEVRLPRSSSQDAGRSRARVAKAASISPIVEALSIRICIPMARAAPETSRNVASAFGPLAGYRDCGVPPIPRVHFILGRCVGGLKGAVIALQAPGSQTGQQRRPRSSVVGLTTTCVSARLSHPHVQRVTTHGWRLSAAQRFPPL